MEYTKGEWKVTEWDDKRGFNIFGEGGFVGSVPMNPGLQHTISEAQTNAHLISAAPDMYEKLGRVNYWLDMIIKDAEKHLKTCNFITLRDAWEADIKNYRAIKKDINKALAKAEGKG